MKPITALFLTLMPAAWSAGLVHWSPATGSLWAAAAQSLPNLYHDEKAVDPPFLTESGWRPLLNGRDLTGWHADNGAPSDWFTSPGVTWRRVFSPTRLPPGLARATASSTGRMARPPTW